MKKILLLLTGGTICSFGDENGNRRDVDIQKAQALLLQYFEKSGSAYVGQEFEVHTILNTLSENMTISKWNDLLSFLKKMDLAQYQGMIVAHGTDTLAYTSGLLSLVLSKVGIPVFLVSSQLPLDRKEANGNENFRRSVELICAGMNPGVYVVYRNEDGRCFLHHGGHLISSLDYSNDFYSRDAVELTDEIRQPEMVEMLNSSALSRQRSGKGIALTEIGELKSDVLRMEPYVGLDYEQIPLGGKVRAVVHGLYHSATACVGAGDKEQNSAWSLLPFLKRCAQHGIPVVVTPCPEEEAYASATFMLKAGAVPVYGMTKEMVYVKTLLSGALGYSSERIGLFLSEDVCGE